MMQSISQVTLAAGHLTELGEGPVGGRGQVRDRQPVGLVGPQPLGSAHHPLVVWMRSGLVAVG